MAKKQIHLKSITPVSLNAKKSLFAINQLRARVGEGRKHKSPISVDDVVAGTKVLEERDATFGQITLVLNYRDAGGRPCGMEFPNFGLEVDSRSAIRLGGESLLLDVDLIVKAGKKKWHMDEMRDYIAILPDENVSFSVKYRCDETTDSAGYACDMAINGSHAGGFDNAPLNVFFEVLVS